MAAQNVCRYFKFGHCKFTDKCRFVHVEQICENPKCEIRTCNLRHPKICKYFRDYNRCKFSDWCSFKHVENETVGAATFKEIFDKVEFLQKTIIEKAELIDNLAEKIKVIEERLSSIESKDAGNRETNNQYTIENMSETTNECEQSEEKKFKCEKCSFETKSERGLNIHKKRKHTNYAIEKYPKSCDICEKVIGSIKDMRKHLKTHSFSEEYSKNSSKNFKCEDCDFTSETIETMEVHVGKCRRDKLECGLCEFNSDTLDNLETHLGACEMYECSVCELRTRFLKDIKSHIVKEHDDTKLLYHMKMKRNEPDIVDFKSYKISEV